MDFEKNKKSELERFRDAKKESEEQKPKKIKYKDLFRTKTIKLKSA
jgi:hypothetical protein